MEEQYARTRLLLGDEAQEHLKGCTVAVFGLGGVGSFAAEALARAGIGRMILVDRDVVTISNLNRQLVALHSTLGRPKAEVMRERILDINPACRAEAKQVFYLPENGAELIRPEYDYIVDAIDNVTAKLDLACRAHALSIPIISAMGAGNKLDPSHFETADIYETAGCPLCRVMRRELRKRGVTSLKVVYSREEPRRVAAPGGERPPTASVPFVPPVMGMILAGEVIRDLAAGARPGR